MPCRCRSGKDARDEGTGLQRPRARHGYRDAPHCTVASRSTAERACPGSWAGWEARTAAPHRKVCQICFLRTSNHETGAGMSLPSLVVHRRGLRSAWWQPCLRQDASRAWPLHRAPPCLPQPFSTSARMSQVPVDVHGAALRLARVASLQTSRVSQADCCSLWR